MAAYAPADPPKVKIKVANFKSPKKVPATIPHIAEAQFYPVIEQAAGPQF